MVFTKSDYFKNCFTQNQRAVGRMVSEKKICLCFCMEILVLVSKTGFKIIKLHAVNHQLNSGSINFNHNWLRDILYNCELTDPVGIMSSVLGTR